jgi:hypothetical protein
MVREACGWGCVGVSGSDAERSSKEDGGTTIVNNNNSPETHAQLAFFVIENRLISVGVDLGGGIVVQPELDAESNKTAYQAPECTALSLGACVSCGLAGVRCIYLGVEIPV